MNYIDEKYNNDIEHFDRLYFNNYYLDTIYTNHSDIIISYLKQFFTILIITTLIYLFIIHKNMYSG
jgi:hypothetical protein